VPTVGGGCLKGSTAALKRSRAIDAKCRIERSMEPWTNFWEALLRSEESKLECPGSGS
jgi:hypothetical protein